MTELLLIVLLSKSFLQVPKLYIKLGTDYFTVIQLTYIGH